MLLSYLSFIHALTSRYAYVDRPAGSLAWLSYMKTTSFMEPHLLIVRREGGGFLSFSRALASVALGSLAWAIYKYALHKTFTCLYVWGFSSFEKKMFVIEVPGGLGGWLVIGICE